MSWHNGPMLAFDVETTGVEVTTDRIVTSCVAYIQPGGDTSTETALLNPGIDIPAEATAVHGITTEQVRAEGEDPARRLSIIAADLVQAWRDGLPVIAMNAVFDLSILDCELARHGLPRLADRMLGGLPLVVDPLVIDRAIDRYRKGKKRLEDLCRVYGVVNAQAHDAAGDAMAAARVAWRMAVKYPGALDKPLPELVADQARWHADWAEHFEAYMRREVDPDCEIGRDWPVRQAVTA